MFPIKGVSQSSIVLDGMSVAFDPIANPNDIVLIGYLDTTSNKSVMRQANASAGYQVPVGKKLSYVGAKLLNGSSSNACIISLSYSDVDIGVSASTALTNPVYPAGLAAALLIGVAAGVEKRSEITSIDFEIPATKFASFSSGATTGAATLIGYFRLLNA